MSEKGIVNTITPLMLHGTCQPDLIVFEVDYSAHKDPIEHINAAQPQNQRIKAASNTQCFRLKLLYSPCMLWHIEDALSFEQATKETLKKCFDDKLHSQTKYIADSVAQSVRSASYNINAKDPGFALESFFMMSLLH